MENSSQNKIFDIRERTLKFAVNIINLIQSLPKNAAGGANVEEALQEVTELIKILTTIVKRSKLNKI